MLTMLGQNGLSPAAKRMEKESKTENTDRGVIDLFKVMKLLLAINSEFLELRIKVDRLLSITEKLLDR